MRRLVLLALGTAGALVVMRRRRDTEFVDVQFEDGATIRFARGIEAGDLLDDAYSILEAA
jgi:hypothetical protein